MHDERDRFDFDDASHIQPADQRTQDEIGGVLERAFSREGGKEPNEEEIRRFHALADEALSQAEIKLSLAREAEARMQRAAERYKASGEAGDLNELARWTRENEDRRREAEALRLKAETLRQYIV